jgi:hypothetical protein
VSAIDTASQLSPTAAAQRYRRAWADGAVESTIAKREDIGVSLTGGGLTKDAVEAIQEYLVYCRAIENDTKPAGLWREYQGEINQHIADNTYSAIQCYRRGGKTYAVSLWFTAAVLAGMSSVIGLPTMLQGKRQLMRDVQINVARLAVLFPDLQKRNARSFNTTEIDYPFGGRLIVLSADKGAEKEGYGCDLLGLDESTQSTQNDSRNIPAVHRRRGESWSRQGNFDRRRRGKRFRDGAGQVREVSNGDKRG